MLARLIDLLAQQRTLPTLLPGEPSRTLDDIAIYRAAGHSVFEILMRTPRALENIAAVRRAHTDVLIGAGTVLTPSQVDDAVKAGADFIVSPAIDPVIAAAVNRHGLPFIPGVCTPTDVAVALREGYVLQKLFPVELPALEKLLPDGILYYDALASPFGHTPLRLIAAYGVSKANFAACINHRLVAGIIAGWLHDLHGDRLRSELDETLSLARSTAIEAGKGP